MIHSQLPTLRRNYWLIKLHRQYLYQQDKYFLNHSQMYQLYQIHIYLLIKRGCTNLVKAPHTSWKCIGSTYCVKWVTTVWLTSILPTVSSSRLRSLWTHWLRPFWTKDIPTRSNRRLPSAWKKDYFLFKHAVYKSLTHQGATLYMSCHFTSCFT